MGEQRNVYSELVSVLVDPSTKEGEIITADAHDIYITLDYVLVDPDPSTHHEDDEKTWEEWNSMKDVDVIEVDENDIDGPMIHITDPNGRFIIFKEKKNVHKSGQKLHIKFKLRHKDSGIRKKHIIITLNPDEQFYPIYPKKRVIQFTDETIEYN